MADTRVLVTGASGLLGRHVMQEFQQNNWITQGLAFSRAKDDLIKVDLNDKAAVEDIFKSFKPSAIINCAAERRPDVVESDPNKYEEVNVAVPLTLAELCGKFDAFLLHISTNSVFDGTNAPYKPSDKTNPLNTYAKHKLAAEEAIKKFPRYGILRIPVLYGRMQDVEESSITKLLQSVKNSGQPTEVSDYELRFPTHCDDVALVCRQMAEYALKHPTWNGIFHWGNEESFTKFAIAKIMAELFNLPSDHLVGNKEPSAGAKRPVNCQLDCSDLKALGFGKTTPFRVGIKQELQQFV